MLTRRFSWLPALLVLLFLASCATDKADVTSTYDPLTRFPSTATYAWNDAANSLPDDPRLAPLDLDSALKRAAEAEFAARGYRRIDSGTPDFLLSYQLHIHNWIGAEKSKSIGSLSLGLAEHATNRTVWNGFVRAEVHVDLSDEEREKRLQEELARLLKDFPPNGGG